MNNPKLLKANVTCQQALEIMDFLYGKHIGSKGVLTDCILWTNKNGAIIAKWTHEYKNLMISEDFIKEIA